MFLFLPAAGNYWTMDADSSRETVARSLRLENKVLQAFANSRWGRFCIRLASRSELFGCSVDGVGVSVPARCG